MLWPRSASSLKRCGAAHPRVGAYRASAARPRSGIGRLFVLALALLTTACGAPRATVAVGRGGLDQAALWTPRTGAPPLPTRLSADQVAAQLVSHLSVDDRLGQMIIMQFTQQDYTAAQAAMIQPYHPGGAILYSYAMGSADQVKALLQSAQHDSPIPMLTMTDLEGGWIDHLAEYVGPHMSAPAMAASGNPAVATAQGAKVAHDLLSFGFNTDLAPDVDVELVAGPDQIGRTFGSTPAPVVTYASAFLAGLQSHGVAGTLKHFPGLGAATTDAHVDLPVISRSRADLEATELAPYRALIASGQAQMIMSTDVLMPALDPTIPAELSRPIITGILRDELHFDGVAITDALYMQGIQDKYYFVQAAVMAIEAGNDMIMAPFTPGMIAGVIAGLKAAIASGALSMRQVNDSVRRILALKLRYHILPMPQPVTPGPVAGPPSSAAVADVPRPPSSTAGA
jgi:beta-N-acetylhexosaminidase